MQPIQCDEELDDRQLGPRDNSNGSYLCVTSGQTTKQIIDWQTDTQAGKQIDRQTETGIQRQTDGARSPFVDL